ncbi:hypothetical protein [Myroides marinus]|uniref:hypothetical protein n=1 Tax=Myroides marinus TaxID=703342 RepID=UPI0025760615|nr:hypothetical protein [Myroides marinus]MDM1369790.1 hypothetical protein [Myroides marinus]MDM1371440.1 hypothetical protein [Myroides marinus]
MGFFGRVRKALGYEPINVIRLADFIYYGLIINGNITTKDYKLDRGVWLLKIYNTNSMKLEVISRDLKAEYDVISSDFKGEIEAYTVIKTDNKERLIIVFVKGDVFLEPLERSKYRNVLIFTNEVNDIHE